MDRETKSFLYFFLACKWRFKRMSEEKLQQYQLKKAQKVVQYAVNYSPYFKEHFEGYDLRNVWSLPTTNKKMMMECLSDYNTLGFNKQELIDFCLRVEKTQNFSERFRGYNVAMSSGTSGSKGVVITSPAEEKYLQAAFFTRFSFPRVLRIRFAFILRVTTPAFQVSKFGQKLTHISQLNTLEEIRRQLQELRPNILSAPPSMLQILAKEVQEGRLDITPKRVVSYAEVLYPDVKKEIEQTFGVVVHQIYQSGEGPIAMSCKHGSLHLNEDLMYVQTFDSEGNPTPPGESCHKMIVTDLHKKSQPIIRFELNDIITIDPSPCKCGSSFRVIKEVMGRVDDMFWAPRIDKDQLQFIFPDYIRRAIISSSEEIEEYQVVQKDFTKVLVRILPTTKNANKEAIITNVQKNIQAVFSSYSCAQPEVTVVFEKPKRHPESLKLIRIHRDFQL